MHNVTADETLNWKTPWSKRRCEIPDISYLLEYTFWQRVFFINGEGNEAAGRWLGVARNVGAALTYIILCEDTERVYKTSLLRSATDPTRPNPHVAFDPELTSPVSPQGGRSTEDDVSQRLSSTPVAIDPAPKARGVARRPKKRVERAQRRKACDSKGNSLGNRSSVHPIGTNLSIQGSEMNS